MGMTTTHTNQGLRLYKETKPATGLWTLFSHFRVLWEALGEGFSAARRYQELTARGMSHEEAASKVFFEHYQAK